MVRNIPGKDEDEIMNNLYEIHIFELRNEEINVKKILAVINATYAVAKRKPGYITNRYRRGQGSNPGKPDFFQALFSQLHKLRFNNCEDLLYI